MATADMESEPAIEPTADMALWDSIGVVDHEPERWQRWICLGDRARLAARILVGIEPSPAFGICHVALVFEAICYASAVGRVAETHSVTRHTASR